MSSTEISFCSQKKMNLFSALKMYVMFSCMHVCRQTSINIYLTTCLYQACMSMYECMYVCMYMCKYTCRHTCMSLYLYTYAYI